LADKSGSTDMERSVPLDGIAEELAIS